MRPPRSAAAVAALLGTAAPALAAPWSQPRVLAESPGSVAGMPSLAVTREGTAIAAWSVAAGRNEFRFRVQRAARGPGRSLWSLPATLYLAKTPAPQPIVVAGPRGGATVSWVGRPRTLPPFRRFTTMLAPGAARWSATVADLVAEDWRQAIPPTDGPALDAAHAVGPDGTEVAVWGTLAPSPLQQVRASVRPPGGAWSPPETISAPAADSWGPEVAIDDAGNITVAFVERSPEPPATGSRVTIATRPAGGAWAPAVPVSPAGASRVSGLQVALDQGTAFVLWRRADYRQAAIELVQRASPSARWSAVRRLSAPSGTNGGGPSAAGNGRGQIVVAWTDRGILVRGWARGRGWTKVERVPGVAGLRPLPPRLALDSCGRALMVFAGGRSGSRSAIAVAQRTAPLPAPRR